MAVLGAICMVVGLGGGLVWLIIRTIKHKSKRNPIFLIVVGFIGLILAVAGTDSTIADFQTYMKTTPQYDQMLKKFYALPKEKQSDVWEKAIKDHDVKINDTIVYSGNDRILVIPSSRYHGQAMANVQASSDWGYALMIHDVHRMTVGEKTKGTVTLTSRGSNIKKVRAEWAGEAK